MIDDIRFPEAFLDSLKDRTIEEQTDRYRVSYRTAFGRTAYGELTREDIRQSTYKPGKSDDVKGLLVKDGVLVEILAKEYGREEPVSPFPYETLTTYYASDNEESGCREREDRLILLPVPEMME